MEPGYIAAATVAVRKLANPVTGRYLFDSCPCLDIGTHGARVPSFSMLIAMTLKRTVLTLRATPIVD